MYSSSSLQMLGHESEQSAEWPMGFCYMALRHASFLSCMPRQDILEYYSMQFASTFNFFGVPAQLTCPLSSKSLPSAAACSACKSAVHWLSVTSDTGHCT